MKTCEAYYGCMKCETDGLYVHDVEKRGERVTYPQLNGELRTDQAIRNCEQVFHHGGISSLVNLPIDMSERFSIDPMHLIYLGVTRKLLTIWFTKRRSMKVRLSLCKLFEISRVLELLKDYIPVEFIRKTRTVNELSRYKATEFRLLLLYVLPVILKDRLPKGVYEHFLFLHVASRILAS